MSPYVLTCSDFFDPFYGAHNQYVEPKILLVFPNLAERRIEDSVQKKARAYDATYRKRRERMV
jgi:hypothetical protein